MTGKLDCMKIDIRVYANNVYIDAPNAKCISQALSANQI